MFTASLFVLLLNKPATCFHVKRCSFTHGRSRHHSHEASPAIAPSNSDSILWEEQLRQEATDALLPVFFPKYDGKNSTSRDPSSTQKPITAEATLKRLLRRKYQHRKECDSDQKKTPGASRKRLAALILGTSVMRLRHWYDVVTIQNNTILHGTKLPIPHPFDSSLCSLMLENNITGGGGAINDSLEESLITSDNNHSYFIEERLLVRAMIDTHAHYLSNTAINPTPTILLQQPKSRSNNKAINLSIQYSLPPFLTSSLLSHYGYTKTKQICSLMNNRGPITIRKNAIRFPGTDEELCKWLWEEDGVRAEPLPTVLEGTRLPYEHHAHGKNGQFRQNVELTAPSDGSSSYIMGSLSESGSVMPSEGTIQLLPPLAKSIWSMRGWQNGYFEVQDAGSQLIVQSLEVVPGESVLDYCAGNGGKTFALASAIMNTAGAGSHSANSQHATNATVLHSQIVAHDVVEERLRQIKGSLSRVGFVVPEGNRTYNGTITAQSSRTDCKCTIQLDTSSDLETTHSSTYFDAVLVDAPCSSTGVLRRRPSQRWDLTEKQIFQELPDLQLEILEKAASFVNENGGKLVYSTCSLLSEENECVVRKFERSSLFLDQGFEPWEFVPIMSNDKVEYDKDRDGVSNKNSHMLTLLPSETGSDGFFIARWKRGAKV